MEILANPNDWIANDSENLAAFLNTETGKRLIPKLAEGIPTLLEGGDTNNILIRSGEVRAWNKTIETLLTLAHPEPPANPLSTEYPSLDDDQAWADGQKLNDPNPKLA
jgi:hypothetical protein